jgi:hypothetical protein
MSNGTYGIQIGGTGFGTVGALTDLRLMRASDVVATNGGTAAGSTVTNFNVIRTGLTFTNLSGSSFYVGSISAIQTPLPITLLNFTGEIAADGVLLKWATSMEKNFDRFEIERSTDGTHYTYLDAVAAKGARDIRTDYSYTDINAPAGRVYYRLKQIDLDGTYDYSPVVTVAAAVRATGLAIYPNPVVNHKITVNLPESTAQGTLTLIDQVGNTIFRTTLAAGEQGIDLDEAIRPGIYYARITREGAAPATIKLWIE